MNECKYLKTLLKGANNLKAYTCSEEYARKYKKNLLETNLLYSRLILIAGLLTFPFFIGLICFLI